MHFELGPEQQMLRDMVRRFVADKVIPHARSWDKAETFPLQLVRELGQMGLLGICIPTALGGAGLGALEAALVVEELARGDGSLALTVASHNGLCAGHIFLAGTPEQKERYVRPLAAGDKLGAWALTEPNSGSDAAHMATNAVRDGEGWRLNGSKIFITQGTVGDIYVVLAATDRAAGTRGITAFIVERDAPGFGQAPLKDKMGMRGSDTAELSFDQVYVPDSQRLGALNQGFTDTLKILDRGRISIAALSVGLGRAALEESRRYSQQRQQFGKPIAEFQAIQWKLADMATEVDAARLLTWRAAWLCDKQLPFATQASIAKLFASEAGLRAADEAVQIHGGYGYTAEFPVERNLRDAKLCTIGEGTSEVQRIVIARGILRGLGLSAASA
jgi:alkylation response protein AidB-like acyl-CoA dehydrogenase